MTHNRSPFSACAAFALAFGCDDSLQPTILADSAAPILADIPEPIRDTLPPALVEPSAAGVVSVADPPTPDEVELEMWMYRDWLVRRQSAYVGAPAFGRSPEKFAASMKGTIGCGDNRCRAGREVCVVSPARDHEVHCEKIESWLEHRTPRPEAGFPPLAGLSVCEGSHN